MDSGADSSFRMQETDRAPVWKRRGPRISAPALC